MFWSKKKEEDAAPAEESSSASPNEPSTTHALESHQEAPTATSDSAPESQDQASQASWGSRLNTAKQLYSTANQVYTVAAAIPQAKAALDPYLAKASNAEEQPSTATAEVPTEPADDSVDKPAGESGHPDKATHVGNEEAEVSKPTTDAQSKVPNTEGATDSSSGTEPQADDAVDTNAQSQHSQAGPGQETQASGAVTEPEDNNDEAHDSLIKSREAEDDEVKPAETVTEPESPPAEHEAREDRASMDVADEHNSVVKDMATEDSGSDGKQGEGEEARPKTVDEISRPDNSEDAASEELPNSKETPSAHPELVTEEKAPKSSDIDPSREAPDKPSAQIDTKDEALETDGRGVESEQDGPVEPVKLVDHDQSVDGAQEESASEEKKGSPSSSETSKVKPDDKSAESELPSEVEADTAQASAAKIESKTNEVETPAPVQELRYTAGDEPSRGAQDTKSTSASKELPADSATERNSYADGANLDAVEPPEAAQEASTSSANPDFKAAESKPDDGGPSAPEAQQPSQEEIEKAADAAKAAARLQSTADALWAQARAVRDPAERERLWRSAYNKEIEAHGQSKKARAMASGWGQGALSGVGVSAALGIGLGNVVGALLGSVVSLPGSLVGAGVGAAMGPLVKLGIAKDPKKKFEERPEEFEDLSDDEDHQRIVEAIRMDEEASQGTERA